jgi:hypothetical protein
MKLNLGLMNNRQILHLQHIGPPARKLCYNLLVSHMGLLSQDSFPSHTEKGNTPSCVTNLPPPLALAGFVSH